jgi:DNA ligase (NAD+)
MEHFVTRKAMNILCGEATIDQLYRMDLAKTPSDFYNLKADQLTCLEGWKERAAARFLDSVKASKSVPFERVLFAVGIRFVGETTARDIARHFGSIEALESASKEDLLAVPEVGEVIADSVYNFFREPENIKEIEALKAAGLRFSVETAQAASDALSGKSIVISGNFSISRDDMKALIEANGGRNSSSVSSKTDYLLAGTKPGPEKLKKAAELGIPVIGEEEFMSMIPASSSPAEKADEESGNEEWTLF